MFWPGAEVITGQFMVHFGNINKNNGFNWTTVKRYKNWRVISTKSHQRLQRILVKLVTSDRFNSRICVTHLINNMVIILLLLILQLFACGGKEIVNLMWPQFIVLIKFANRSVVYLISPALVTVHNGDIDMDQQQKELFSCHCIGNQN